MPMAGIGTFTTAGHHQGSSQNHRSPRGGQRLLYVLRGGIPWRMLPHDLPPWGTVWWYFRKWRDDGTWEQIMAALRERVREAAGRDATPSAAIIDSQSVQTTEKGGPEVTTRARR